MQIADAQVGTVVRLAPEPRRKQATLPPCKTRYPAIAGGRVLNQAHPSQ